MDYLVSKVMLMVAGIALSKGPHFFYCLLFFYIWALFKLIAPEPSVWGMDWYWVCTFQEVTLFALALFVKPNGKTLFLAASTIQILAHTSSLYTNALYDVYPNLIRTCEIAQCIVLIIWSPIVLSKLAILRNRLEGLRTWMLRLLKQVTT